jgi:hypothetical protein
MDSLPLSLSLQSSKAVAVSRKETSLLPEVQTPELRIPVSTLVRTAEAAACRDVREPLAVEVGGQVLLEGERVAGRIDPSSLFSLRRSHRPRKSCREALLSVSVTGFHFAKNSRGSIGGSGVGMWDDTPNSWRFAMSAVVSPFQGTG